MRPSKAIPDFVLVAGSILVVCALPFICGTLLFYTPILFYGQVVDEHKTPISGATVNLSFCSNPGPGEGHAKTTIVTDSNGFFFSWGFGLGVVINTSKKGYHTLPESGGSFCYSGVAGKVDQHSNSKTRAIFVIGSPGMDTATNNIAP